MIRLISALFMLNILRLSWASLRSSTYLTKACYNFPLQDFSHSNCIKNTYGKSPHVLLTEGNNAIDFTLSTAEGEYYTLSTLLKSKPVLLLWGHYTCPAFQGYLSDTMFINCSYTHENELIEKYSNQIHFVHIISSEPHPNSLNNNYDTGNIRMNFWSTYSQPLTYSERLEYSVPGVQKRVSNKAILLVDKLDGADGEYNNPVWCTYSHAARGAILINQDGLVKFWQDWFNSYKMAQAIDELF